MKKIDILAIGDISTDVFIKIKEAEAFCDMEGEHCKLCLNYGGKIPYESSEVCFATGNSSNVAIAASKLGLNSALVTSLGDDENGSDCLKKLEQEKVNIKFITREKDKPTNYHYVLWYGKERTILTKHEKYNYELVKTLEENDSPSWIYLSSLGENSLDFHKQIINYLEVHPEVKLAFQPGTFQIKLGKDQLKDIYIKSDVFLCNHEEVEEILDTKENDIPKLLKMIYDLGPKLVIITDGINGAYSYDGNEILFMKSYYEEAIESTGAGDAFSGAFMSALSLDKNISEALIWGAINAASVVLCVGPHKGLMSKDQIEEYLKNSTSNNQPIKI